MFYAEDIQQGTALGRRIDPSFINIRRHVKNNAMRIEYRIQSLDRVVESDNVLITVLASLNLNPTMTYEDVEWRAMRSQARIANSIGFTSPGHYGKVFNGVVIKGQDELISLIAEPINPEIRYDRMIPMRFLHHPYTNLDWSVGTSYVADTFNVLEINLVALAWQYVKYMRTVLADERKLNMKTYVYRYVIFRTLPSYFNLSVYNRHIYHNEGFKVPNYTANREFQVPNVEDLMVRHVSITADHLKKSNTIPTHLLSNIPFLYEDYLSTYPNALAIIPKAPANTTYQQRWLYQLLEFKFIGDVLGYKHTAADKYKPRVVRDITVFKQTRIIEKMPKHLYLHINRVIFEKLEKLLT